LTAEKSTESKYYNIGFSSYFVIIISLNDKDIVNSSESKIVSMTENKYSSACKSKYINTTEEFDEADYIKLRTYEEYEPAFNPAPEHTSTYQTVEEIIIEDHEMDEKVADNFNKGVNKLDAYSRPLHVRSQHSPVYIRGKIDIDSQILQRSNNRRNEFITLDQAMAFKYTPHKSYNSVSKIKLPKNYPVNFTSPCQVANILERMASRSKERRQSSERFGHGLHIMTKSGSSDTILTSSLKEQVRLRRLHSGSQSTQNFRLTSTSNRRFKFNDFNAKVGKLLLFYLYEEQAQMKQPKVMQKEAFDKIYKRFMDEKYERDRKIEEK